MHNAYRYAREELFKIVKMMVKNGKDIVGERCIRNDQGSIVVDIQENSEVGCFVITVS